MTDDEPSGKKLVMDALLVSAAEHGFIPETSDAQIQLRLEAFPDTILISEEGWSWA